jgi:hypothetical protein
VGKYSEKSVVEYLLPVVPARPVAADPELPGADGHGLVDAGGYSITGASDYKQKHYS